MAPRQPTDAASDRVRLILSTPVLQRLRRRLSGVVRERAVAVRAQMRRGVYLPASLPQHVLEQDVQLCDRVESAPHGRR